MSTTQALKYTLQPFGKLEHKIWIDGKKVGTVDKEGPRSYQAWILYPNEADIIRTDRPCENWPTVEAAAEAVVRRIGAES